MTACLLSERLPRIEQDDSEVRLGRAGDHVARVLRMAGTIDEDELPAWSAEVAVRDIDGDPLLALSAQAVGDEGDVGVRVTTLLARALHSAELVAIDRARIDEQ